MTGADRLGRLLVQVVNVVHSLARGSIQYAEEVRVMQVAR